MVGLYFIIKIDENFFSILLEKEDTAKLVYVVMKFTKHLTQREIA